MLDKLQAIQNPSAVEPVKAKPENAKPFRAISAIIDGKQKIANGAAADTTANASTTVLMSRSFFPVNE